MPLVPSISDSFDDVDTRVFGFDITDRQKMRQAITLTDSEWNEPTQPLNLSDISWQPDLVKNDGTICHIHNTAELRNQWVRRMKAARNENHDLVIAAPLNSLYSNKTLIVLDELEVKPMLLQSSGTNSSTVWSITQYRSIAEFIAKNNLKIDPSTLKSMGNRLLEQAIRSNNSNERGWMFEDFLCLLFSQISYFEVYEHNFETHTEEIDVVIKNRCVGDHSLPVSPLVLVSAKNTKDPVGVPAFTSLQSKMTNRRGMCRIGFLCASKNVASTVLEHELRFSREDKVIVLLDGSKLRELLNEPEKIDCKIENMIVEAALQ